jgi:ligand-binding SRPBCC domain-containing protein
MKIYIKTKIEKNYRDVFSFFNSKLFLALKPPLMNVSLDRFDGCKKGDEVHLRMDLFGFLNQKWISHITDNGENSEEIYFVDEGTLLPPPLRNWRHVHHIQKIDDQSTFIIDDIDFTTGNSLLDYAIYPALYSMFYYRKPIYRREIV